MLVLSGHQWRLIFPQPSLFFRIILPDLLVDDALDDLVVVIDILDQSRLMSGVLPCFYRAGDDLIGGDGDAPLFWRLPGVGQHGALCVRTLPAYNLAVEQQCRGQGFIALDFTHALAAAAESKRDGEDRNKESLNEPMGWEFGGRAEPIPAIRC